MGKDAKGLPFRAFVKDDGLQQSRAASRGDTLYRYEDHFLDPDTALDLFADVPFLNGGLFECLDCIEESTNKKLYLDGFSRDAKKRPAFPNRLFFGDEHDEDLSAAYGDKKRKKEKVRGLLHILHAYKFTIVENTPVDQEIALDPELLGKVFENLLASYNEETKTTARKQTGSFYTPRPIVEYMVDGSLKSHLTKALTESGKSEQDVQSGLDILFSYSERAHSFSEKEVVTLLDAIHTCKILDPACGSGAFPMGMLHKLVYVIHKLDPDNARWKQIQIDAATKIPDFSAREAAIAAIERDFTDNEDDYGRKLYLIENCLYGVDIQPIAIQISKLRFFISLICDQRTNRNKRENHGIRPLPNLETKFVVADTLTKLPEIDQFALLPGRVYQIEGEIEALYHNHFGIQRRDHKLALQGKIKVLREELGKLLSESLGSSEKAQHIADWDPFDPQTSSEFFDPHWMFGKSLSDGFDIVLGNPPYVFGGNTGISEKNKRIYKNTYISGSGKINLFTIFIERGSQLLKAGGVLTYILPNTLLRVTSYKNIRNYILENLQIDEVLDLDVGVFDAVTASTIVIRVKRNKPEENWMTEIKHGLDDVEQKRSRQSEWHANGGTIDIFSSERDRNIIERLESGSVSLGELCSRIRFGVVISGNLAEVVNDVSHGGNWKPFLEGDEIGPYTLQYRGRFLNYDPALLHRSRTPDIFECRKIMILRITGGQTPIKATLDDENFYNKESILNLILAPQHSDKYEFILAILNSKIGNWFYRKRFTNDSKLTVNLSKEYVGQIPVKIPASGPALSVFSSLVNMLLLSKRVGELAPARFLEDLIDACVMECYFHEHMAERGILFLDDLAPQLSAYDANASEAQRRDFIFRLYRTLNAPSSDIRNRLLRISADSPDLLAVIKNEDKE
jgi:tRNA1(Val) A37 N6-methylase TrmN6